MNPFDDLADPLGPPPGDALRTVLARARRRRATHRAAAVVIGAVAVVSIAASAVALKPSGSSTLAVSSKPSTPTTGSTVAPTTTSFVGTSTTSTTRPITSAGLWSDRQLTITPHSLGRVQVGMTLAQAQTATGLAFDGSGDGAYYPTTLPAGYPHLFVGEVANGVAGCVGAEIGDAAVNPQEVLTPEGFRLGDTVERLKSVYGSGARYVPAPSGGISPRAGYVVTEPDGNLAFYVDSTNTRIFGIKGGGRDLTPSACNG